MIDPRTASKFFEELLPRQVPWTRYPSVLTFFVTSGVAGHLPAVALARIARLEPGELPTDMQVHLEGSLPRALLAGECVTVSISRYEKFHGYQLKTAAARTGEAEKSVYEVPARGELVLHARQAYTTHHGPYELNFFERIPYDEVHETLGTVDHGVLALGPTVNISPRFVWHHRLKAGRLATYHGDGVTMKTYRNLQVNKSSVRVVFDFAALSGYALFGHTDEVTAQEEPEAWRAICGGFAALGFGQPSRLFRHVAERIEPFALAKA